ncbi:uncharacterized protein L3040_003143 [Drepanopeziza brunnea f. sp. 'multigermtubi']|uniref:Ecp3 n=2 Tax=Drepanopeziza brunnea f. sp. 'multigermtubi' TaxID=698441 RepID=D2XZ19_9HELO|nr:putative Ecp7(P20) [Drepanopeziza brunnea f. sp. 'multigermtubi' MB_m1]ADB23422.1 Ecp3 [Drepanopeziza brunnea f. sp. 'multigermtubi']AFS30731.1 LysM13p [Drepanopeziza brunnea f. sp. 'multigermtubi']EKD15783.1 putative Ecp7(P20) [Drepanopeziza brunnea f. sp. 'multigermtubi' MB_m1]KAJ5047315.1 hypothetical protein L3040_003143 [Drepanopeziza brunnea f. sp. 'multigermtubi']
MRFNNNLFLLASFLGAATAFRRTCRPDLTGDVRGTGFYTKTATDLDRDVATDFCTTVPELRVMNPEFPSKAGDIFRVPCKIRKRDCSRIPTNENGYYTVVEGDYLSDISIDFCTDTRNLAKLNPDLANTNLAPGMVLEVPCPFN